MGPAGRAEEEPVKNASGYIVLMRDGFVCDGIWIFKSQKQLFEKLKIAEAEKAHNNRNYQGRWEIHWYRDPDPVRTIAKKLGTYTQVLGF
jgi:hypothetical protein